MWRNYHGEGSESSSSSSSAKSSSRKKRGNNSEKSKQPPQRGLGVAELERIRLQSQMASGYIHGPYPAPPFQMGVGDIERSNIRYADHQPSPSTMWNNDTTNSPGMMTQHLLGNVEGSTQNRGFETMESRSQNSESNENQDVDLELRLSNIDR